MSDFEITWQANRMGACGLANAAFISHAAASGFLHSAMGWAVTDTHPRDVLDQLAGDDGTVLGTYRAGLRDLVLVGYPAAVALVSHSDYDCDLDVSVSAADMDAAAQLADRLLTIFPALAPITADERSIYATYWFATAMGPSTFRGVLPRVGWDEISGNYATPVRGAVAKLSEMTAPDLDTGRVVLLHGPPGTGKSRMLAALANEWSEWADLHVVSDPATFFEDRSYLMSVAERFTDGHGQHYEHGRWAVLVLEDADRFIDKRQLRGHQHGDGISALLNMADGMLGVSMRVMFVLTTNVDMDEFDAALTRPGRCLANIHVPNLSQPEAVAWLAQRDHGGTAVGEQGASLAELYDRIRPATQATIVASGATMTPPAKTIVRVVNEHPRFNVDPSNAPLVAGGTIIPLHRYPAEPSRGAFAKRRYNACTPVETNRAGEIWGHIWDWTKPHIGMDGRAVYAPRNRTGYSQFLGKPILCDDGTSVRTGPIYIGIDHAPLWMAGPDAQAWMAGQIVDSMANTRAAVADVVIYEDEWGGQIAGAFRPHVTAEQARIFQGSDVSPDWRENVGGMRGYEMFGLVSVNTSGLIVAGGTLVASGASVPGPRVLWDHERGMPRTLVAVGMVRHQPVDELVEIRRELRYLAAALADQRADAVLARLDAHPMKVALDSRADAIVAGLTS